MDEIEMILAHGEDFQAGRGCRIYRIPRKELRYLEKECPPMLWRRYRDRIRKLAAIVDDQDHTVVTVMHRRHNIWRRFR